jgi:SNF2 family DNA or RNA helicase
LPAPRIVLPALHSLIAWPVRTLLPAQPGLIACLANLLPALQELDMLLRRLKAGGHKALIFTQMARMLDILEVFLNLHGYTYLRLDGSTRPEQRQLLMQRFNSNPKLFVFILSTRSGGVGMNLTGADTVIFYDSDWNPAMDAQVDPTCPHMWAIN